MVVRMRTTKSKTGSRRSHHGIHEPRLSKCEHCSLMHIRHRVCLACGYYRGKKILDVEAKALKEEKKKAQREAGEKSQAAAESLEAGPEAEAEEREQKLSVEELSKR